MTLAARQHRASHGQSGAATLIVVMVLFFIVSLLAAYTNRNLIFEQKTSANQYRSTQAFEAADAGLEWALSMLNGGVVTDQCTNGAAGDRSFAQRYLAIDDSTGRITHATRSGNWPTCVFNGTAWANCACPFDGTVAPAAPTAAPPTPAFRVWPAGPGPAGVPVTPVIGALAFTSTFAVRSVGCTRLPETGDECLDYEPNPELGDGVAHVESWIALRSALAVPPAAAITAQDQLTPAGGLAKLLVVNSSVASGGITINIGNPSFDDALVLAEGPPGAPGGNMTIVKNDPVLRALDTVATAAGSLTPRERMFVSVFGMKRQTYLQQPGLRVCGSVASPCTPTTMATLLQLNPNRIIWVDGDLTLDADIGSTDAPVMLIVNGGRLTLGAGVDVTGFVYLTGDAAGVADISLPDAPTSIVGAVVAEKSLTTTYPSAATSATNQLTVRYNLAVLDRIRWTYGSWVRTGSAWRDFRMP